MSNLQLGSIGNDKYIAAAQAEGSQNACEGSALGPFLAPV